MESKYFRFQRKKSSPRSPGRSKGRRRRDLGATSRQFARQLTDWLLFGVLLVAPLVMGGRSEIGRFAYVLSVGLLAVSWSISRTLDTPVHWRPSGIAWLLLAGLGLICFQLAPLPQPLIRAISPWTVELLPLWGGTTDSTMPGLGALPQLSLTPHATLSGLFVYGAHVVLFLVLVQRLRDIDDVERALRCVAAAILIMAVLGLGQYLSGTEKYTWIFQHPSRNAARYVCGPFSNANHFSHFLVLGIGPLIWWYQSSLRKIVRGPTGNKFQGGRSASQDQFHTALLILGFSLVALAVFLSRSRGGMLMLFLGCAVALTMYVRFGQIGRQALVALGLGGLLIGVSLVVHGLDSVSDELETLAELELDESQSRQHIWAANLKAARMFPWVGAGVGSHREIYPVFFEQLTPVEYSHAENGYLQLLTETGVVGLGLFLAGAGYCLWWGFRAVRSTTSPRVAAAGVAVLSSVIVSLSHSIFDFPWYLPATMSLTVILCACGCALERLASDHTAINQVPAENRRFWITLAASVTVVFLATVWLRVGPAVASVHWNRYRCVSLGAEKVRRQSSFVGIFTGKAAQDREELAYAQHRQMIGHLQEALRWDPRQPHANLRMASVLLKAFEFLQTRSDNAMALSQIRAAALASNFPDIDQQNQWLDRALGDNRRLVDAALVHLRRSVALSPLLGRAYLFWSELAFLEGVTDEQADSLVRQAALVRPYDEAVQFAMGRNAILSGDITAALERWKFVFHRSEDYRDAIIRTLGPQWPPAMFLQHFQPDASDCMRLFHFYRLAGLESQAREVAPDVINAINQEAQRLHGQTAAKRYLQAVPLWHFLGEHDQAVDQARLGVKEAPNDFKCRYTLATRLVTAKQWDEAIKELGWCSRRRPSDGQITKLLDHANRRRSAARRAGATAMVR